LMNEPNKNTAPKGTVPDEKNFATYLSNTG
jgi:hypothetical protein